MKRTVKQFGWGIGLAIASIVSGWLLGGAWYDLWWKSKSVPMPPFTRYILPHQWADYHIIRLEMILWAAVFVAAIGWAILRRTRNQQTLEL